MEDIAKPVAVAAGIALGSSSVGSGGAGTTPIVIWPKHSAFLVNAGPIGKRDSSSNNENALPIRFHISSFIDYLNN